MKPRAVIITAVWPEATSSAAGMRTTDVIRALGQSGWSVGLASPGKRNRFSELFESQGIECHSVAVNDSSFDSWIKTLSPQVVIFDRFTLEEQFSWRVREHCPQAIRILDTVDLHFLRRARELAHVTSSSHVELKTEDAYRELASIYRSDLTWVLSDVEERLLREVAKIPTSVAIEVSRFAYPQRSTPSPSPRSAQDKRRGFVMIGNYRHPPNLDGVRWLRQKIWPVIRERLPQVECHIYGAYIPKEVAELADASLGFLIKGWAKDSASCLAGYRVNLAPLRFGAGLKGKITDGWFAGTPVVTTPIGAEGMAGDLPFGGAVCDSAVNFAAAAIDLHENLEKWITAVNYGAQILKERFSEPQELAKIVTHIEAARRARENRNLEHHLSEILWQQSQRSTEFFSRWLEEKKLRRELQKRLGECPVDGSE